jgi:hypothetical protein
LGIADPLVQIVDGRIYFSPSAAAPAMKIYRPVRCRITGNPGGTGSLVTHPFSFRKRIGRCEWPQKRIRTVFIGSLIKPAMILHPY